MALEQKIKTLIELYHYIKGDTHFCGYIEENATQSLETAIETMKKYQKIEEIIRNYDVTWEFHHMKPTIDKIREVLEDGNDK